jgi:hypothetical protein
VGYSARYHAASILAVFAALLIGIVVGAGLGSEVVSDTRTSLEESLEGDLDEARAEADDLRREAERERSYADRSYPLVVDGRLRGRRVAIVGLGDASVTTTREIEAAVNPAGARLVTVAILREVPDRVALSDALGAEGDAGLDGLGEILGRSLAGNGRRAGAAVEQAFSRTSGSLSRIDSVVLVREGSEPAEDGERAALFESALVNGLSDGGARAVGAERFEQSASAIGWFDEIGVDSVDNVDETTGKTSLVFSLRGVRGKFGRKPTADRLIPDLLTVASRAGR